MARPLTRNARSTEITTNTAELTIRYHYTNVFSLNRQTGALSLDTGGWLTATTKLRMNQGMDLAGLPYTVYQEDHDWYVWRRDTDETVSFTDDTLIIDTTAETLTVS